MKTINKFYKHLASDSLYRNSIYLMLSTLVMSFLGFFFWIISARLYSTEQVGIGATLISVMTLISSLSILGLDNGLIRYLPTAERKNDVLTSFSAILHLPDAFSNENSISFYLIKNTFLTVFNCIKMFVLVKCFTCQIAIAQSHRPVIIIKLHLQPLLSLCMQKFVKVCFFIGSKHFQK